MRTLLKVTHRAIVLLLGVGGVLWLLLWVNSWGQWANLRGEVDFEIGSQSWFLFTLEDDCPPYVNVNSSSIGWDASFEFLGIDFRASRSPNGMTHIVARFPWWFLFTIFSLYPAIYLIRRKRPATEGHCVKCGYDLRGSKRRCPECGLQFGNQPKRVPQDVPV